ncbi:MAG: c-type cytochrome [Nitrospirae bacterium]|nr:c-type cytochrome [Nitrospirota bacterium]
MGVLRSPLLHAVLIFGAIYGALKLVHPPIPSFVMAMYSGLLLIAILLYLSTDEDRFRRFSKPILDTLAGRTGSLKVVRLAAFVAIPLCVGYLAFQKMTPQYTPPAEARTVHPEPPLDIQFKGRPYHVQGATNPYRSDKGNREKHVAEGMKIYYQNCYYCHGDNLNGKGPFAPALNPIPANFRDPGTIAQLQESFVFWRVALGWRGLPNGATPWNSAMPAWEDTLSEEEIWKVILYIYEATGFEPRTWGEEHATAPSGPAPRYSRLLATTSAHAEASAEPAKNSDRSGTERLYLEKCSGCHGEKGDGNGPAHDFMFTKPRDFTRGIYKIRSTVEGAVPADEDLHRAIALGLPGTTMPPWKGELTDARIRDLVGYVKAFSPRFGPEPPKSIPEPPEPPDTPESRARGKEFFDGVECFKCHGQEGLADGPSAHELKDDWGNRIFPGNLSKPWNFRRGTEPKAIFRALFAGIQGTPMPAFGESLEKPDDLWDIVHYIRGFSMEPKSKPATLLLAEFSQSLPTGVDDPQWDKIAYARLPLLGQIVIPPRNFTPANDIVFVKTLHDGQSLALLVEWHDNSSSVTDTEKGTFADRIAVQFPAQPLKGMEKPHFVMGDPLKAVNLWTWDSDSKAIQQHNANGVGAWKAQSQQDVNGSVSYLNGRYKAFFTRRLVVEDEEDLPFPGGAHIPVSFMTWDGHRGETEGKCSISAWYHLMLKEKPTKRAYAFSLLWALVAAVGEVWIAKRASRA